MGYPTATATGSEPKLRDYAPEPTARQFHKSNKDVRGVMGPVGCLPCDSEYLSTDGWRRMDDYDGGLVGQWENGVLSFVDPEEYVVKPCDEFIEFKNKHALHMVLSEEHRVPLYDCKNRFVVKRAHELEKNPSRYRVPTTFGVKITHCDSFSLNDDLLRLAVAINADGHFPNRSPKSWCTFSLRKKRKKERLRMLLNQLGIKFKERVYLKRPTETVFTFESPLHGKHYDGGWWLSDQHQLETIFDEVKYWDGLFEGPDTRFSTTDKGDADFIQYVAHAVGGRATISKEDYPNHPNWKTGYTVHIAPPGSLRSVVSFRGDNMEIGRVPSVDGKKYCFVMPSGFFLARHNDRVFATGNTGKTVICCMEVWSRILEMPPCADGVRRSRWAFIRNTYPELISTTMNTWKDWVPDSICHISMSSPITGKMDFALNDGTRVKAEIIFIAIDRPEEARKLKSLELTGAFLNEASELDEEVKKMALQRTGRYPALIDDMDDDFWTGVIMDTNPPSSNHWWYRLAEKEQPTNHQFWRQPPALLPVDVGEGLERHLEYVPNQGQQPGIPPAENVQWQKLGYNYWMRQAQGADNEWIKVYLMGEYGHLVRGRPVYPEYNDAMHFSRDILPPLRGVPIVLGFDFGLTPACAFVQQSPQGTVQLIDECVSEDMDLRRFMEEVVNPKLHTEYFGMHIIGVGDPAGNQRSQADGQTCMQILRECGVPADEAPTNSFLARRDAVGFYLTKLIAGRPGFLVSPKCEVSRRALQGEYRYKELRIGGMNGLKRFSESPDKNFYSHIMDAVQYSCLRIRTSTVKAGSVTSLHTPRKPVINVSTTAYS